MAARPWFQVRYSSWTHAGAGWTAAGSAQGRRDAAIRILHLSDTHAHYETMQNLNAIVPRTGADVIALTGDNCSATVKHVPREWNKWPGQLMLSVPGNHDEEDTFAHLTNWVTETPWFEMLDDVLFVGVDERQAFRRGCVSLPARPPDGCAGVAVLCHRPPEERVLEWVCAVCPKQPVLWLHGHEHPTGHHDPEWEARCRVGSFECSRSKVTSAADTCRGNGQTIRWRGGRFTQYRVERPRT
ncbi:MAG: hypothetical protein FJX72_16980 [Armatimonadetes bacterium]|nr:hypothetical protein [Armatimonadota bacterium]